MKKACLLCIGLTLGIMGCSKQGLYNIEARNQSFKYGIIWYEPKFGEKPRMLAPALPIPANNQPIGRLTNNLEQLPDKIEVVWQLAELSNCSRVRLPENYPGHAQRNGCTFTAIPNKIYRKMIDIEPIRESEEGKKAGKVANMFPFPGASSHYTLWISFIFENDQLDVNWNVSETNPWL